MFTVERENRLGPATSSTSHISSTDSTGSTGSTSTIVLVALLVLIVLVVLSTLAGSMENPWGMYICAFIVPGACGEGAGPDQKGGNTADFGGWGWGLPLV